MIACEGVSQAELWAHYEAEYAEHEAGLHKESAHDYLAGSWQGSALQVACILG